MYVMLLEDNTFKVDLRNYLDINCPQIIFSKKSIGSIRHGITFPLILCFIYISIYSKKILEINHSGEMLL